MPWSTGLSLRGQRGSQLVYTNGAPGPNDGIDGDSAIDTKNGRLYAQKSAGAWPSSYASLTGPAGLIPTNGKPDDSVGGDNSYAIDQATAFLWGPKLNGTWPSPPINLTGPAGPLGGSRQYTMDAGFFWSTGGNFPTTMTGFNRSISNENYVPAVMDAIVPMRTSGCVRSIAGWVNGPTNGFAVNFALYKNGAATGGAAQATASGKQAWFADFESGAYTFSAGDILQLFIAAADASVDQSFSGFITIETSA